jgi:hypothetical protein
VEAADVSFLTEAAGDPRPRFQAPSLSWVVGAVVVGIGAYTGAAPLADNSFFTHLATGRYILENGFPGGDVYSFTAPGERWVVQSWLASVLYGVLDSLVGLVGVRALSALVAGCIAGIVWLLTKPAGGLVSRLVIAATVLTIGATMWAPRPLMVGLLLLGITLLVAEGRLPSPVLLPVFWVWVNAHGSFPLGLVALACLALGRRLDGETTVPELRALSWAAGGTVLGAVNPIGPALLLFPLELLDRQDVLSSVVEWRSPSFSAAYGRAFLVLMAIAIVALVRRPSWRAAVPLVVFVAAGLIASRNIPVAALVLIPGIARGAEGLGGLTGEVRSKVTAALAAVVVVAGIVAVAGRLAEPDLELRRYPVDAVAWLDQEGLLTPGTRRATSDVVGNYLELLLGDRAAVFSDDRVDMYPRPVVEDELALLRATPEWRSVLDRWSIDLVLWERTEPLAGLLALDPEWRLTYADQGWVVYERRTT